MPRAKRPKIHPIETKNFELNGEAGIVEVWKNFPDEGTKGAHTRSKRNKVLDAVLRHCEEGLAGNSNITKPKFIQLIYGSESLIAFGKIITTIAKVEKITIDKTLAEEIAKEVRFFYQNLEAVRTKQVDQK